MRTGLALVMASLLAACITPDVTPVADATDGDAVPIEEVTGEPAIDVAPGAPPAALDVADVVVGDGASASPGSTVTLHYVGATWAGEKVASTWDRGAPVVRRLEMLVPGVRDGVAGMRVGGRRRIVVPPGLGYGDDPPNGISAGATLVFVVDLIGVHDG